MAAKIFQRRIEVLQERMMEKEIDVSLIMSPINIYYLSGTAQRGVMVLPSSGEATLYVSINPERAKTEAENMTVRSGGLKDAINEIKNSKIVGLEEDVVPVTTYKQLYSYIYESENVSSLLFELRKIKDKFEIEYMKKAIKQVDETLSFAAETISEGMREFEASAILECQLKKLMHDGYVEIRDWRSKMPNIAVISLIKQSMVNSVSAGPGLSRACPVGSGNKKLRKGDVVWIDITGRYNGYTVDITRTFTIGKASIRVIENFENLKEIYTEILKLTKKGAECHEIYERAMTLAKECNMDGFMGRGFGKVKFIGHGIGLEMDEPPAITNSSEKLAENMTLALEPKVVLPGDWGVAIESTVVVQKSKCKVLEKTPVEIIEV